MSIRFCVRWSCAVWLYALVEPAHAERLLSGQFDDLQIRRDLGVAPKPEPARVAAAHRVELRGSLREEGERLAALDRGAMPYRQVEAIPFSLAELRRTDPALEEDWREFTLRGRLLVAATLPYGANKASMGTGFGGEAMLDWRLWEHLGPYIAANYVQIGGITATENPLTTTALNGGLNAISYSSINARSNYALATFTAGIFAQLTPFRLRASVGVGYNSVNASYSGVTQTQLNFNNVKVGDRSTVTGKELAPARSWSLAGTAGVELDLVKALELMGGDGILPRGFSADIGVEGVAGNAFLRPANAGSAPKRGPLGFLSFTGGASYRLPVSSPWIFRPTPAPPPPFAAPGV
jgi:hypothetical protein